MVISKAQKIQRVIDLIDDKIGTLNYKGSASWYSNDRVNALDCLRDDLYQDLNYAKSSLRDGGYW